MAVSVIERPLGHIFDSGAELSVESITDSSGDALVTDTAHGLIDGDYVYMKSPIEAYCGFWYVDQISANTFKIKRNATADFVAFVQTAGTTTKYYEVTASHNWNCAHLPIVYKLSNTNWPINTEDTARTITAVTDSNGYCALALSGDIKTTGAAIALDFVKITNSGQDGAFDDLDGVYQIISYTNETTFVIDLPFSNGTDLSLTAIGAASDALIQFYYNNYHNKVQVWGGMNNGHTYYAQEPYELLATLDLVPDENNEVKFSIHEIIKNNIAIKNNLQLSTLPNNMDAWTGFFIKYAEVYDDSDGTTLGTTEPTYTSDLATFEGYAVNAILPFKNTYSGALSEYAGGDEDAKFLTSFVTPTLFEGYYFDLSFIRVAVGQLRLQQVYYTAAGAVALTTTSNITQAEEGVYRIQLTDDTTDTRVRVDVTIINASDDPVTETKSVTINRDCLKSKAAGYYLSWLNPYGGFDYWLFAGYADEITEISDSGETEENPFPEWPNSYGEFADTMRKQTYRTSREQILVRSQHLTADQVRSVKTIKTSPLVQIVNSIYDRRTVLVDTDSFTSFKEGDNLHEISFTITYTDDVPSQKV
jgi:hypothetical protein